MSIIPKNLVVTDTVFADLVSTSVLVLAGGLNFTQEINDLKQKLLYQTAVPNVTKFKGTLSTNNFVNTLSTTCNSLYTNTLIPFNGSKIDFIGSTVTISGNLNTNTTFQCSYPSTSVLANYTPLSVYFNGLTGGNATMVWGRSATTNNSSVFQWDVTNVRGAIGNYFGSHRILTTTTDVRFTWGLYDRTNNPIRGYMYIVDNGLSFSMNPSAVSSAITSSRTDQREFIVTIADYTFTTGNGVLPITLQVSDGTTFYNSTADVYKGCTSSSSWGIVGIYLTGKTPIQNRPTQVIVVFSYLGVVTGKGQLWSVSIRSGESAAAQYHIGGGRILFPNTNQILRGFRLFNTANTNPIATGTLTVAAA